MTPNTNGTPSYLSRLDRGARLTLALVLLLFVWSAVFLLYYFSLPTDGWLTRTPGTFGSQGLILVQDLMGTSSGLQSGDHLIAIEGLTLDPGILDLYALERIWQAGQTLHYTVERSGTTLDVPVRLVQWQLLPALNLSALQSGGAAPLAGELVFLAVAVLAFIKRPGDHAARPLLLFATLFPVLGYPITLSVSTPQASISGPLGVMGVITITAAYTVLFPPALLHLALVFPRPKPIVARHPRLEALPYLIGVGVIPFFVFQLYLVGYAWTILSIVGTIVILIHSAVTMRDALSRAQLLWGLWGFIVAWLMFLPNYLALFGVIGGVLGDVARMLPSWTFSVLGITLGIAILRYRLFDIDVIIRRTLIYSVLTGALLGVYFGSVVLLQAVFRELTGAAQSELVTVISTLTIAALFIPLRQRVQRTIDRRFYRRKYDAAQITAAFAASVRDQVDLDGLAEHLQAIIKETMQPEHLSLWLADPARKRPR